MNKQITLKQHVGNITPEVVEAISKLSKVSGATLSFDKGEYHFYTDGAYKDFFAPTNNKSCDKQVAFPVLNADGLTIDGNGSTFVFHDEVSPFIIQDSRNITIKNLTCTTPDVLESVLTATEITDGGFFLKVEPNDSYTYETENGSITFKLENHTLSGKMRKFAFHSRKTGRVIYLFTGDTKASTERLAAPFILTDAVKEKDGIRFIYRAENDFKFPYSLGEEIGISFEESRERDVIFLNRSKEVCIENVAVKRGGGMGIIGQCCKNVSVKKFRVTPEDGELTSVTADALHFVNCFGKLEVKDCTIGNSIDDVCNIHGIYSVVGGYTDGVLTAVLKHNEQSWFNPYEKGDRIAIIDNETLNIVAHAKVVTSEISDDGMKIGITVENEENFDSIKPEFFIELPEKMPDVEMTGNTFFEFPHIRISGGGKMLVANNRLSRCSAATLALDLSKYWYESGRIKELTIKDNFLSFCNARNKNAGRFIEIGVSGYSYSDAPLIHEKVVIENNYFEGIEKYAVIAGGLKKLVMKNNKCENGSLPESQILVSKLTEVITD